MAATVFTRCPFWVAVVAAALVAVTLSTSAQRWLGSLRLQKVQAVDMDLLLALAQATAPGHPRRTREHRPTPPSLFWCWPSPLCRSIVGECEHKRAGFLVKVLGVIRALC